MRMGMMRTLLALAAFLAAQFACAAEELPFPDLDTEGYCTALVSKMLVKTEQQVEKDKCLTYETAMKAKLKPFWDLVEPAERERLKRDYIKEVRFQTYRTVGFFVASALGMACLDGRAFCSPGKPTADAAFLALRSDHYCYLKNPDPKAMQFQNCLKEETARKSQLANYWSTLPKDKMDWCISTAFRVNREFPPFQILSTCFSEDIGTQCLMKTRQCRRGQRS